MIRNLCKLLLAIPFIGVYVFFVILMFFYGPLFGVIAIAAPFVVVGAAMPKRKKVARRARADS